MTWVNCVCYNYTKYRMNKKKDCYFQNLDFAQLTPPISRAILYLLDGPGYLVQCLTHRDSLRLTEAALVYPAKFTAERPI